MAGQMIQSFHTFGITGQLLWVNPWAGQPPAVWYCVKAQLTVTIIMITVAIMALVQNPRLRWISRIACCRASCSLPGASRRLAQQPMRDLAASWAKRQ